MSIKKVSTHYAAHTLIVSYCVLAKGEENTLFFVFYYKNTNELNHDRLHSTFINCLDLYCKLRRFKISIKTTFM